MARFCPVRSGCVRSGLAQWDHPLLQYVRPPLVGPPVSPAGACIAGVGLGLAYVPAIVSVSEYFERRRTIALGLAVSGVGFGCFVFPPIIRYVAVFCFDP